MLPRRDCCLLAIGQSNLTNLASTTYESASWLELVGANDGDPTQEANVMGAVMASLAVQGFGGYWAKHAAGGQALEEFAPGGSQYAAMQTEETLLRNQFGAIDILLIVGGESNASAADSQATVEGYIDDVLGGLVAIPTAVIACSPLNMAGVLDANEAAVRAAFAAKDSELSYFHHVSLATVNDDDDLSANHMVRDSTIEAARDLILPVWTGLYP